MDYLTFDQIGSEKRPAVRVRRLREDGYVLSEFTAPFSRDQHYREAAKRLGVADDLLQRFILNDLPSGANRLDLPEPVAPLPLARFRVRLEAGGEVGRCNDFPDALAVSLTTDHTVIEWDETGATCALDCDWHKGTAPMRFSIEQIAATLEPAPIFWWITRSGGLRGIYNAREGYTADELAAVGGLAVWFRYPTVAVELNKRTRRPPGEYWQRTPTTNLAPLARLLADNQQSTEAEIADWLMERGYNVGERYDHCRCPVNPSDRGASNVPPVLVNADSIYCFICAADGVVRGGKPGWFPVSRLLGKQSANQYRRAVENWTHWAQARYVDRSALGFPHGRLIYRAALRNRHGSADPRIESAMVAGEPMGVLRVDRTWTDHRGQVLSLGKQSSILAKLPAVQFLLDGKPKVSAERLEWFGQSIDLAPLGYPSLRKVWGQQVTELQDPPSDLVFVPMMTAKLSPPAMTDRRPRYLAPDRRLSEAEAVAVLQRAFPGLDVRLVKLLIAAKGCAEHSAGLPPMVFLIGPTGAGKTATPEVAAAIVGDKVTKIEFAHDTARLRAGVSAAKEAGTFAVFDEYLKGARRAKIPPVDAMEVLLGLTPDSTSHRLYVGPVELGALPVLLWSDTSIPIEVYQHAQIGRRLHLARLSSSVEWEASMRAEGIIQPSELRTKGGEEYLRAADSLLSIVMDGFFPPGGPSDFAEIAAALGFGKLRDTDLAREKVELAAALFAAVCSAPDHSGIDNQRWPVAQGWRVFDRSQASELRDAFLVLHEAGGKLTGVPALEELDLRKALGLKHPATVDARSHGNKVAVRFRGETINLYNKDLK